MVRPTSSNSARTFALEFRCVHCHYIWPAAIVPGSSATIRPCPHCRTIAVHPHRQIMQSQVHWSGSQNSHAPFVTPAGQHPQPNYPPGIAARKASSPRPDTLPAAMLIPADQGWWSMAVERVAFLMVSAVIFALLGGFYLWARISGEKEE